ncbi:MAG: YraN family protein [Sciscionella sp.]|nr:YraN family protein [Sciscionella sp.]
MARRQDSARDKELGRRGEQLAVEYLEKHGVIVLSRNWRCRDGELDIVGTDRKRLIVCEVKTRSSDGFGQPVDAISEAKMQRIRRLANAWLAHYHVRWCQVRFDVISVYLPRAGEPVIEHLPGAF